MNLNFSSPIYLIGLLGISFPILVHFLTNRREKYIKFSAVYLLLQSQKRSTKRFKPNRFLLLLIRCLAIACMSLSLAHPIFSLGTENRILNIPSANVIILDDSYSMRIRSEDTSLFDLGIQTALRIIKEFPKESSASLVLTSNTNNENQKWTKDLSTFSKQIELLQPSFDSTNIAKALSKALLLLDTAQQKNKRIYLLTDLDHNGWNVEDFDTLKSTKGSFPIKILDLSKKQTNFNRAVLQMVTVGQEFLSNGRFIKVRAKVRNPLKNKAIRNLRISLWIDNQMQGESFLNIPPQSTKLYEFLIPLEDAKEISGFVEVEKDALSADNRRYFYFQSIQQLEVLLVDGDPKTVAHQSETFYLERALNPFNSAVSDINPTVSTLEELPSRNLEGFSVILLCNVRELPPEYELELEKFVFQGGTLLISLGDQIEAKFYNEKMGNLLSVRLESLNQVQNHNTPFHFNLKTVKHPTLSIFNRKILREMETISFYSIYNVTSRTEEKINAPFRFKNQDPAIVEGKFGEGKVILFVSTLDRDWNDFPIQPTFLPWIQRWIKYASKAVNPMKLPKLTVGDTINFESEGTDIFYVKSLSGHIYKLIVDNNGISSKFNKTWEPGVYKVFRSSKKSSNVTRLDKSKERFVLPASAKPAGSFTVNVNSTESVPEKINEKEILNLLQGTRVSIGTEIKFINETDNSSKTPISTQVLILMASFLFYEGWLVRRG